MLRKTCHETLLCAVIRSRFESLEKISIKNALTAPCQTKITIKTIWLHTGMLHLHYWIDYVWFWYDKAIDLLFYAFSCVCMFTFTCVFSIQARILLCFYLFAFLFILMFDVVNFKKQISFYYYFRSFNDSDGKIRCTNSQV